MHVYANGCCKIYFTLYRNLEKQNGYIKRGFFLMFCMYISVFRVWVRWGGGGRVEGGGVDCACDE